MLGTAQLPMPLAYVRIMLRTLGADAKRRARLLENTRITEAMLRDPSAEATLADFMTMFENAHAICEPGWTLEVTSRFDVAAQGALGVAMTCAPTLADSFDIMARYGHVRAPWFRLEVFNAKRDWGVRVVRQFPLPPHIYIALAEGVLLGGQTLVESVLGRAMTEGNLYFDYSAPEWHARYSDFYRGKVVFGADFAGLTVPAAWRDLPCPLGDSGMYQAALARLELERRRLDSADLLTVRVSMLLAAAGDAGLDLESTAERMNVSRRTLIRRLKEAGTSFGELLESHRMARAKDLLRNTRYTAAEIGYRLGYAEPANFTRAFKRRVGVTPSRFRDEHRVPARS